MGIVSLVIFLFFLPYAWLLWAGMSVKTGKTGISRLRYSLAALLAVILASIGVNSYFSHAYQLSFFQNGLESLIALILCGAVLLVIAIVNVVVSIVFKVAPKSVHNQKAVWMVAAVLCATILFFTMWVYPLGEKASYIHKVEKALAMAEQQQVSEEITVLFLSSEKQCIRTNSSNCHNQKYSNSFFLKNNLDEPKEVQVRIRALDADQQELKVVESDVMELEAGELKLVQTEETSEDESLWSRSSFETDCRVRSYESLYRFRDAN